MSVCRWQKAVSWLGLGLVGTSGITVTSLSELRLIQLTQSVSASPRLAEIQDVDIPSLAQRTTVRILTPNSSGSGVIVNRQGQIYTVLTNWHVVGFSEQHKIMTPDGQSLTPVSHQARQLGNADLATSQFYSSASYEVARISQEPLLEGERVYAAGFPMYQGNTLETTFDQGIQIFRFTEGEVSLLPPKSLPQGYRLGYTNEIAVGMSGGPIFNAKGFLIGINGRLKNRDPAFGVYGFADGTEPSAAMLERMVSSSWGIPISTYLQFVSSDLGN